MVTDTSAEAFHFILNSIGRRQTAVYKAIEKGVSMTNSEIAVYLQLPINQVTPRTNELVKKGLVRNNGKRECNITHQKCMTWEIVRV